MIGSASHVSTGDSFRWFLEQASRHGLPDGIKIIVAGDGSDKNFQEDAHFNRGGLIDYRGWLKQTELDELLGRVGAVLIPQRHGFGALTRLPEFSLAGVPAIVSRHAVTAVDSLPRMTVVDDEWDAWRDAIERHLQGEDTANMRNAVKIEKYGNVLSDSIAEFLDVA